MPDRTVAVVTDSSCGVDADLAAYYGVCVVPVRVLSEGRERADSVLRPEQVLEELESGGDLRTQEPQALALLSAFKDCEEAGAEHVVVVVAGPAFSDALLAAESAADTSPIPVTVVDSGTASLSLGLAALAAGAVSLAGGTAEETAAAAQDVAASARMWLTVGSLDRVRSTGLLSELVALFDDEPDGDHPLVVLAQGSQEPLPGSADLPSARQAILDLAEGEAREMDRPVAMLGDGSEAAGDPDSSLDLGIDGPVIVAPPSVPLLVDVGPDVFVAAVADMPEAFFTLDDTLTEDAEGSLALAS